jgi:hypothetical protein
MQNIHSSHLEDLIIDGKEGLEAIIDGLEKVQRFCEGDERYREAVTLKYDGSVAIVAGWINDRFFVGSKSVFNKTPKINYSNEDIRANHTGELVNILDYCLDLLERVIPKGKIYQGDLLFYPNRMPENNRVHCNKLVYDLSTINLQSAKLGIVFHSEYNSDLSLKSFVVYDSHFFRSKDVCIIQTPFISPKEYIPHDYQYLLSFMNQFEIVSVSADLKRLFLMYQNSFYRYCNVPIEDPFRKTNEFNHWLFNRIPLEKKSMNWAEIFKEFDRIPFPAMFSIINYVTEIKLKFLEAFQPIHSIDCYVIKKGFHGFHRTAHEGYMITEGRAKGSKLVDRNVFSRINFDENYLRGW